MAGIWSDEALRNIIFLDEEQIEKETLSRLRLEARRNKTKQPKSLPEDGKEILDLYFGHPATHQDYISYIDNIASREFLADFETSDVYFVGEFMNGFLLPQSNFAYLSSEDWILLYQVYGFEEDTPQGNVAELIISQQNKDAVELLMKGYDIKVGNISLVKKIIQPDYSEYILSGVERSIF